MLKAKHHFIVYPFFQFYTLFLLKRRFHSVTIKGRFSDEKKPVLLIANHVSWWDGFWAMYLKLKLLKRKFYFMMREDQLRKFRFFNYTGAFSVHKKSRETIETLQYASSVLKNSENMLLIYPQGKIRSLYDADFTFEQGIERILRSKENDIQVVFSANLVDYFSQPKPSLYIYVENYRGAFSLRELEAAYRAFYRRCVKTQTERNAE